MKFKILAVTLLIVGIVCFSLTYSIRQSNPAMPTSAAGGDVKIKYRVTERRENQTIISETVRLQRANGDWKEMDFNLKPDGNREITSVTYGLRGRGVYRVDERNKELSFRAPQPDALPRFDEEQARASHQYGGEATVLGYRTVILNINSSSGRERFQIYKSPVLNGLYLKDIYIIDNLVRKAVEATEIRIEPITDQEFGSLPNYPVNNGSFENQVKARQAVKRKN